MKNRDWANVNNWANSANIVISQEPEFPNRPYRGALAQHNSHEWLAEPKKTDKIAALKNKNPMHKHKNKNKNEDLLDDNSEEDDIRCEVSHGETQTNATRGQNVAIAQTIDVHERFNLYRGSDEDENSDGEAKGSKKVKKGKRNKRRSDHSDSSDTDSDTDSDNENSEAKTHSSDRNNRK